MAPGGPAFLELGAGAVERLGGRGTYGDHRMYHGGSGSVVAIYVATTGCRGSGVYRPIPGYIPPPEPAARWSRSSRGTSDNSVTGLRFGFLADRFGYVRATAMPRLDESSAAEHLQSTLNRRH